LFLATSVLKWELSFCKDCHIQMLHYKAEQEKEYIYRIS
jgi:hypothetical protein